MMFCPLSSLELDGLLLILASFPKIAPSRLKICEKIGKIPEISDRQKPDVLPYYCVPEMIRQGRRGSQGMICPTRQVSINFL
jgi:hypothetical protein